MLNRARGGMPASAEHARRPSTADGVSVDDFALLGALGSGATSEVLLVRRRGGPLSGELHALKVMRKAALSPGQIQQVVSENELLQSLSHPYLCALRYAFQDAAHFFLVLQHVGGGDLATHLASKGAMEEASARLVLGGAVLALRHLHEVRVVYRDLKPENILLDHRDGLVRAQHVNRPSAPLRGRAHASAASSRSSLRA